MASFLHILTFVLFCGSLYVSQVNALEKACKSNPADIGFILDGSSSIYFKDFTLQKNFVMDVVDLFVIGPQHTRIGLVTFATTSKFGFGFDAYSNDAALKEAINRTVQNYGQTYTNLALKMARERLFENKMRPGIAHIAIVITDGDADEKVAAVQEAEELHSMGVDIIAIGVGDKVDHSELEKIASKKENVLTAANYKALESLKKKLAYTACQVTTPIPPTTTTTTPTTTTTTLPQNMQNCSGTAKLDVMFGLPPIAGPREVAKTLKFFGEVVDTLIINSEQALAGLIGWEVPQVQAVALDASKSNYEFNTALDDRHPLPVPYADNHILLENLASAYMYDVAERNNVVKTAVLVLDAESSDYISTQEAADMLKKFKGIRVIVVAVGGYGSNTEPKNVIAWRPSYFIKVPTYNDLSAALSFVRGRLCESIMQG